MAPRPRLPALPLLCLAAAAVATTRATVLLLGPTTDLQATAGGVDKAGIVGQLLELVDGDSVSAWNSTFAHVTGSGGALHARQQVRHVAYRHCCTLIEVSRL